MIPARGHAAFVLSLCEAPLASGSFKPRPAPAIRVQLLAARCCTARPAWFAGRYAGP